MNRGKSEDGEPHRRERFLDAVAAAERPKVGVGERLNADREPVDAGVAVAAKTPGFDAGRVGLQRHLGLRLDPPVRRDRVEDAADGLRAHQRGRAAAEEDRANDPPRRERRPMSDFGPEGREKPALVDRSGANVAIEVAIGAFRQAEWPVDIDPEARIVAGPGPVCRSCAGKVGQGHRFLMT